MAGEAEGVVIQITGDFNFSMNKVFHDIFDTYPKGEREFLVDLDGVQVLDTSALGLLLRLREHSRDGKSVILMNPTGKVRDLIREAGFASLFRIIET